MTMRKEIDINVIKNRIPSWEYIDLGSNQKLIFMELI